MSLLGDSGATVCWVGEHGVRMYASSVSQARSSHLLLRQAALVSHQRDRLNVARRMYASRFPGEDLTDTTMQQLRGREGARMRRLYRQLAEQHGVEWAGRDYTAGDAFAAGNDVNRLLSAAHASLYGICHAATAALGASPGLGFIDTGTALSFVLDIADLYKADTTIPLAFQLAAEGRTDERDARLGVRDIVRDHNLLPRIVDDIIDLLDPDRETIATEGTVELWDDRGHNVSSGRDHSHTFDHHVISGPEVEPADWT